MKDAKSILFHEARFQSGMVPACWLKDKGLHDDVQILDISVNAGGCSIGRMSHSGGDHSCLPGALPLFAASQQEQHNDMVALQEWNTFTYTDSQALVSLSLLLRNICIRRDTDGGWQGWLWLFRYKFYSERRPSVQRRRDAAMVPMHRTGISGKVSMPNAGLFAIFLVQFVSRLACLFLSETLTSRLHIHVSWIYSNLKFCSNF